MEFIYDEGSFPSRASSLSPTSSNQLHQALGFSAVDKDSPTHFTKSLRESSGIK